MAANLERKMAFTDKPHWIGHDASRVCATTHRDLTWTNGFYKKVVRAWILEPEHVQTGLTGANGTVSKRSSGTERVSSKLGVGANGTLLLPNTENQATW